MPQKYAIRITQFTLPLIRVLSPFSTQATAVKEDKTYFLFTVDSSGTTTDHDVVHEDDFEIYDGDEAGSRLILAVE